MKRCLPLKILLVVPAGTVGLLVEPPPEAGRVVLDPVLLGLTVVVVMAMTVPAVLVLRDLVKIGHLAEILIPIVAPVSLLTIAMTGVPVLLMVIAMTAVRPVQTPIGITAVLVRPLANVITGVLHDPTQIVTSDALEPPLVIRTTVVRRVLRAMQGLVHRVVNLMIAVAARVVQDYRERAHHVASTTVLHVNVGARIAPSSHVYHATNRARAFSVMTLAPVLTAMTARAQVVPLTVIAGNGHSRQKSKNALMPSGLPSPLVGVA